MSMQEMLDACMTFGVSAEIRKCENEDLLQIHLPVIAHMNMGEARPDHYMLLTEVRPDGRIKAIDGTTAEIDYFPVETISNIWTGYVLVIVDDGWLLSKPYWLGALAVLLAAVLLTVSRRVSSKPALVFIFVTFSPSSFLQAVVADSSISAGALPLGNASVDEAQDLHYWRKPENDGLCCLYLQIRHMGYAKPFVEYLADSNGKLSPRSLEEIAVTARRLG